MKNITEKIGIMLFLFPVWLIFLLCMVYMASAQPAKKQHRTEMYVSAGTTVSGNMKTIWPAPYDKWDIKPSKLYSIGVNYKVYKNVWLGANIRSTLFQATNLKGVKMFGSRETSWMMLSVGLFADYRVHLGKCSAYVGLSCERMSAYDDPKRKIGRIVSGDGWVYGPRAGFIVPLVKQVAINAHGEYLMATSRGVWYNNPSECKVVHVPVMMGVRFTL